MGSEGLPASSASSARQEMVSGAEPPRLKALQRHAGPEPAVMSADGIKLRSSRYPDEGAKLVADKAD